MGFVYLLHFGERLAHAEHYAGATNDLRARLKRHARGHGSAICRELRKRGIQWRLAAVWLTESAFSDEDVLKGQHNGRRFCPICCNDPARLADAMPIDPEELGIGLEAREFL